MLVLGGQGTSSQVLLQCKVVSSSFMAASQPGCLAADLKPLGLEVVNNACKREDGR